MLFFFFGGMKMKNDSIVRKQMMLYMATIAVFVAVVCGALTIFYT